MKPTEFPPLNDRSLSAYCDTATPSPAQAQPGEPRTLSAATAFLGNLLGSLRQLTAVRLLTPRQRRLQVRETISLGDKRFLSIVEVDGQEFLVGGGSAAVSLLTKLPTAQHERSFHETASEAWQRAETA